MIFICATNVSMTTSRDIHMTHLIHEFTQEENYQNARVISDLENTFQQMFNVRSEFMVNLEREFSNHSQNKLAILLVDTDQVPRFYQKASVEATSKLPMPVFVVGSANRMVDLSVVTPTGNFHLALAQKSKDSTDDVITIVATKLQDLLVSYDRQKKVVFVTISDDRIFETVTHTLR